MNIDQLKKVIQAVNPDFNKRLMQVNAGTHEITVRDENVRLADVLLALEEKMNGELLEDVYIKVMDIYRYWNLKDDNLDHQSDETKQFLIDLLVPTKS